MKLRRLIAVLFCAVLMAMPLAGCKDNGGKTIVRLSEVAHSIFYAPLYVAINNGYFDEYNIDLKLSNGSGADKVMTAVSTGAADIGLMGPEATI